MDNNKIIIVAFRLFFLYLFFIHKYCDGYLLNKCLKASTDSALQLSQAFLFAI